MTAIDCAFYSTSALTEKGKLTLKKIFLPALLSAIAFVEELPAPARVIERQGITAIRAFDAPGGMKGYPSKYQDTGVTIYLILDSKHAISGYTYNEEGGSLSNTLVEKEIYTSAERGMWQRMKQSHWLPGGKKDALVTAYTFVDPFCPYCKQFWQQARPWVDSGKVQLRTLSVGVTKPESSAAVAAILASKDPTRTWRQYEASGGKLKLSMSTNVSTEQMKVLGDNEKLVGNLGTDAIPAIYHMSKENTLQQAVGLSDQKIFDITMGNKQNIIHRWLKSLSALQPS